MRRFALTVLFAGFLVSALHAQSFGTAVPKAGDQYFGKSGTKFDEKTLPLPEVKPQPAPPPVVPGDSGILFPPPPPPPKIWSGSAEFGVNGASGNSELVNARAGFHARRKTDTNLFDADLLYTYARQNGIVTQQQALFNARDEILFPGSKWSLFASTNVEYDDLKDYDFLIGVYGGIGYLVAKTDTLNWRVRGGAGAVWEVGTQDDVLRPEAILGTDFSWKISERQAFIGAVDYYPSLLRFSQLRLRARVAYQIVLDPETGTILRFGVQERYDSNSGTSKPNDLTYYATLGFSF